MAGTGRRSPRRGRQGGVVRHIFRSKQLSPETILDWGPPPSGEVRFAEGVRTAAELVEERALAPGAVAA